MGLGRRQGGRCERCGMLYSLRSRHRCPDSIPPEDVVDIDPTTPLVYCPHCREPFQFDRRSINRKGLLSMPCSNCDQLVVRMMPVKYRNLSINARAEPVRPTDTYGT